MNHHPRRRGPNLVPTCAARRILDTSTGARRFSTSHLMVPSTSIFIGNSPIVFGAPFSPDVEKLWERALKQRLPQKSVFTPCREDLFLAHCAHGTRHRWWCLKWLVDVAEILRKADALDWSRIEEMARIRPGAGATASVAVSLAHDLLEVPVPAEAERILPATDRTRALASAIQQELLSRGYSSGDEHTTLLALEGRPAARMNYRAARVARYPESLFRQIIAEIGPKDRRLIRLPRKLEFLYHFIRSARLVLTRSLRIARTFWAAGGGVKLLRSPLREMPRQQVSPPPVKTGYLGTALASIARLPPSEVSSPLAVRVLTAGSSTSKNRELSATLHRSVSFRQACVRPGRGPWMGRFSYGRLSIGGCDPSRRSLRRVTVGSRSWPSAIR